MGSEMCIRGRTGGEDAETCRRQLRSSVHHRQERRAPSETRLHVSPILSRWGPDALSCGVMQVYFLRGILVALMLALVSVARPAGADAKADCAKAYEASQEQRSSGKLLAAKESLVTCSQAACPSFIKKDCSKWLSDVEGSIPTVVFSARFGSEELSDVKVSVGDKVLAETCLLYTSPSPRDRTRSRMPSSA